MEQFVFEMTYCVSSAEGEWGGEQSLLASNDLDIEQWQLVKINNFQKIYNFGACGNRDELSIF